MGYFNINEFGLIIIALMLSIAALVFIIIFNLRSKNNVKDLVSQIEEESPFRKNKVEEVRPHNDFKYRDKKVEKKKQLEQQQSQGVTIYDPMGLQQQKQAEENKIVALAEPTGFWSKFVMSQKLGFIMARMNAQSSGKGGFWVNLIKAQGMSQGKDKGLGR